MFSIAIAGDSEPVSEVMPDTAQTGIRAQITVDGMGVKKRDIWPIKTPLVSRLSE